MIRIDGILENVSYQTFYEMVNDINSNYYKNNNSIREVKIIE